MLLIEACYSCLSRSIVTLVTYLTPYKVAKTFVKKQQIGITWLNQEENIALKSSSTLPMDDNVVSV